MSTSDLNTPPDENAPETRPGAPSDGVPQWASDLKRAVEELPGKLHASVTDADKESIGEHVFRFFERGGAFEREEHTQQQEQQEEQQEQQEEHPPQKAKGMSRFAEWFAGSDAA